MNTFVYSDVTEKAVALSIRNVHVTTGHYVYTSAQQTAAQPCAVGIIHKGITT